MVDAKKSPKKAAVPTHPPYAQMVTEAIKGIGGKNFIFIHSKIHRSVFIRKFLITLNFIFCFSGRKGASLKAISAHIESKNKVGPRHATSLKLACKRMLEAGTLAKAKGVGLSGSFKLAKVEKPAVAKKPAAKKPLAKKPAAKKTVKKTATKKASPKKVAKKPAAKKASPKKVAKKVTKKASPKKVVKKVVKKPAAKKTKAKK